MARREDDTVQVGGDPVGLVSHLALQRARARLLGRADALTRIGRYEITHRIGIGGMGVVYAGYDPDLERPVAVKVLRSETDDDPARQAWLLREAQALARLSHPNVVVVYEVGKHEGHVYLAMELVEGRTLEAWVRAERPSVKEIVRKYIEAGRGLEAAHAADVLHRDFKPDNAIIGHDGRVRVLDFGLAHRGGDGSTRGDSGLDWSTTNQSGRLTVSGTVMGTPRFMAPEQHEGQTLTSAADQFSFCASLWGAIARKPAFPGDDLEALAAAKRSGPPVWTHGVKAPKVVVAALRRGLSPQIDDRWPGMQPLLDALSDGISSRRRNRMLAASAGTLVVAGSTMAAAWSDRESSCTGAEQQLGEAWDAHRRDTARAAFDAVTVSYAAATWDRVSPRLDDYAAAWMEQYTDNCEATRVRGDQSATLMDVRAACLQASRRELDATTRLLTTADATTIERADDLVLALPSLQRCADTEQLLQSVPPPAPEIAGEVAEIRDVIARATTLRRAGKYDEADAALAPAMGSASAIDYRPLHAEIQLQLGLIRDLQGRYDEAEVAHTAALRTSLQTGQWDLAARASTALVMVVGLRRDDKDRGLAYATTAWGVVDRTSRPLHFEAELRRSLGAVYRGGAEFDKAIEELREALRVAQSDPDADPLEVADARSSLGLALMQSGKLEQAEVQLRATLQIRTDRLGPEHPDTATNHLNLGAVLQVKGDLEAAEQEYRAALEVLTAALGPEHPSVASVRGNLAGILVLTGRLEEAVAEGRDVLRIEQRNHPPGHTDVISARSNLASYIGATGRHEEAAKEFRAVIAALQEADRADDPLVASAHLALGIQMSKLGRHADALAAARTGLKMREQLFDDDHPGLAEARGEVADALVALGRAQEALPLAEAAWSVHADGNGPPEGRAHTGFIYARAIHATGGDRARALEIAETSRDLLDTSSDQRARIEAWLAKLR